VVSGAPRAQSHARHSGVLGARLTVPASANQSNIVNFLAKRQTELVTTVRRCNHCSRKAGGPTTSLRHLSQPDVWRIHNQDRLGD